MPPSVNQASQISTTSGIASAATALAANTNRRWFIIQNLGTNPLFVKFGTGATTSVFDMILKAGTVNDDGLGASFTSGAVVYTGIVTIAGTSPRYIATDI
jgi:hypothetical protein